MRKIQGEKKSRERERKQLGEKDLLAYLNLTPNTTTSQATDSLPEPRNTNSNISVYNKLLPRVEVKGGGSTQRGYWWPSSTPP